jgi:hypothetical protein
LEIIQIKVTENRTVISLKVTNKRDQGAWFCADKNIYIKNSKGIEKYHLINSENIPTCPNQHEFKNVNEILEFQLVFPKITNDIVFLDLIEDCNNACFSFHGIILDNNHNEKIRLFEKALDLYINERKNDAIPLFEKVLSSKITIDSEIHGFSYYYLIEIYSSLENKEKVNYWIEKLKGSEIQGKDTFLRELKAKGIKLE